MKMIQLNLIRLVGCIGVTITMLGASCQHVSQTNEVNGNQPEVRATDFTVMFYNVENLFDIYDDPKTGDEDFTPSGKLNWTQERYEAKLEKLAEVIDDVPGELPALVGFAEIENRKVLEDLIKEDKLSVSKYRIIHKDSPDERGIDAAAIVDTSRLSVEYFNFTTINLPNDEDPYTRDLLYIKGKSNGEVIHFFVNHWPSRGGGQEETEKNRIAVANVLESQINKIQEIDPKAKILIMGDFNDHPDNKSIQTVLNAGVEKSNRLYNYMFDYHANKEGSYWYKGEWGALDQFIGSQNLKNSTKGWGADKAHFLKDPKVLFTDKEGIQRPNRTYAGEKYTGGYSDHLAIYIALSYR